jgi:hypothetical protein
MKNRDMIKKAWAEFDGGDLAACLKTLDRIRRNFALTDDEFDLELIADLEQPSKAIAEQLIADGKADWVGDWQYLTDRAYLKWELRISIRYRAVSPYRIYVDEDGDTRLYCQGRIRLDRDGDITSLTSCGGQAAIYWRQEIKRLAERWLRQEFGKVEQI